jgi:hypothetical protein
MHVTAASLRPDLKPHIDADHLMELWQERFHSCVSESSYRILCAPWLSGGHTLLKIWTCNIYIYIYIYHHHHHHVFTWLGQK